MKSFLLNPYHRLKARSKRRQVDAETRILAVINRPMPDSDDEWWYGYDLHKATGLRPGRMYPALYRLEDAGMLDAEFEEDRIPRKYRRRRYRLDRKRDA